MTQASMADFTLRVDPWFDLVYHTLSHVPVAGADASSLFDEGYVRWSARQLAEGAPRPGAPPRTAVADAALLASLYEASRQGFLLHAWPLLWDSTGSFLRDMRTDFAEIAWPTGERAELAAAIRANTAPELPDLFRTALWAELGNGYEAMWDRAVAPRALAFREGFLRQLGELRARLPGLSRPEWVLSHPLRVHGRLLQRRGDWPAVAVGVADAELGVGEWDPAMQACHECLVWSVGHPARDPADWSTVPGRPGHEAFEQEEGAALTLGARLFLASPWEEPYLAWLSRLCAGEPPRGKARRLATGEALSPEMAARVGALLP